MTYENKAIQSLENGVPPTKVVENFLLELGFTKLIEKLKTKWEKTNGSIQPRIPEAETANPGSS